MLLDVSREHDFKGFRRIVAFSVAVPVCPPGAVAPLPVKMLEELSTDAKRA